MWIAFPIQWVLNLINLGRKAVSSMCITISNFIWNFIFFDAKKMSKRAVMISIKECIVHNLKLTIDKCSSLNKSTKCTIRFPVRGPTSAHRRTFQETLVVYPSEMRASAVQIVTDLIAVTAAFFHGQQLCSLVRASICLWFSIKICLFRCRSCQSGWCGKNA